MHKRTLYKEISRKDKRTYLPKEQESDLPYLEGSILEKATESEIIECHNYYEKNKECHHHLVYDESRFIYNFRYCGICGKFIALI